LDHGTLELGKDPHHAEHRFAGGSRRIETLLVQEQINPQRVQFGKEADQILQTPAESINRPRHDNIKLPPGRRSAKGIEGGAFVPAFGAADTVVLVDFDNLAAHPGSNVAKLALLIGRRLVDC
jgi:hypothetical protein